MPQPDFMDAVIGVARSAKGPEGPDLVAIAERYRDGEIDRPSYHPAISQIRARILIREGPYRKPWPRNEQTEDYCAMRLAAHEGGKLDPTLVRLGAKGRAQYDRWCGRVVDAFDTRARLMAEFWAAGRREDCEAYNMLLSQGDVMASYYRGLSVPWWPRHMGDKYSSVLGAWGELRTDYKPVSAWGSAV